MTARMPQDQHRRRNSAHQPLTKEANLRAPRLGTRYCLAERRATDKKLDPRGGNAPGLGEPAPSGARTPHQNKACRPWDSNSLERQAPDPPAATMTRRAPEATPPNCNAPRVEVRPRPSDNLDLGLGPDSAPEPPLWLQLWGSPVKPFGCQCAANRPVQSVCTCLASPSALPTPHRPRPHRPSGQKAWKTRALWPRCLR